MIDGVELFSSDFIPFVAHEPLVKITLPPTAIISDKIFNRKNQNELFGSNVKSLYQTFLAWVLP